MSNKRNSNKNSTIEYRSLEIDNKTIDRSRDKLDDDQKKYYDSFDEYSVVCVDAPAGTGKTYVAVMKALYLYSIGKINKIFYIRIPDDRSLRMGFLPGTEEEKQAIYTAPFYCICEYLGIQPEMIDEAVENREIILTTDVALRGVTIDNSFVIIDEAQNGNISDLKLILTRITDRCKVALIGQSSQYDNKSMSDHAFRKYIDHFATRKWAIECRLTKNYRGKISQWADQLQ